MSTRTDVHSPKNLVTEDYDYLFCYSPKVDHQILLNRQTPESHLRFAALAEAGVTHAEASTAGVCDHCGAHCEYRAVLLHRPSNEWIQVGEICLSNRFERATREFQRLRKQAALDRQLQRIKTARDAWQAAHPAEFEFLADFHEAFEQGGPYDEFFESLWGSLTRHGELSERQLAALQRSIERRAQWAEQRAAEQADEPAPAPVVTGRIQVTGKVLSVKTKENAYGVRLVMTVLDDRGFKVWGSVPSAIDGVERGERITFTATVERSDRDETFGFFKRPTQAEVLEGSEAAPPAPPAAPPVELEPEYTDDELAAYSGYVGYGHSMSDGYYAPISIESFVRSLRENPERELTCNDCPQDVKDRLLGKSDPDDELALEAAMQEPEPGSLLDHRGRHDRSSIRRPAGLPVSVRLVWVGELVLSPPGSGSGSGRSTPPTYQGTGTPHLCVSTRHRRRHYPIFERDIENGSLELLVGSRYRPARDVLRTEPGDA